MMNLESLLVNQKMNVRVLAVQSYNGSAVQGLQYQRIYAPTPCLSTITSSCLCQLTRVRPESYNLINLI